MFLGYVIFSILLTELSSRLTPAGILIDVVPGVGRC